jgi:GntR family transcriptional repressor for pyruvate dehydrogenase complex
MLKPIGKQRVAEEIVQQLRSLILRGVYGIGDKLPPERKLAEDLGVNRASLREAIKSLEQMGLVKTRQGDGTRVLPFMETAGVELVSHLVTGTPDGIPNADILGDVLEFRRIFARDVAQLAAERATPDDLVRMEDISKKADAELSPDEMLKLDFEFYVELTRSSRNRVFQLLINTIRVAVFAHAGFFAQVIPSAAVQRKCHRDVIAGLKAKDAERTGKAVNEYMQQAQQQLATLLATLNAQSSSGTISEKAAASK